MILYQDTEEYHEGYEDGLKNLFLNPYDIDTEEWDRYNAGHEDSINRKKNIMTEIETLINTLIEIAEDAQQIHGCPNANDLRRHLSAYTHWQSCQSLTLDQQNEAIQIGFMNANKMFDIH